MSNNNDDHNNNNNNNNNEVFEEENNTKVNVSCLNHEVNLLIDNFEEETGQQKDFDENATENLWTSRSQKLFVATHYEFRDEHKKRPVPWFIICISFVQLSIYIVANECFNNRLMLSHEHHFNQFWRYITYIFVHSDYFHLMLNICLQVAIGSILECEEKRWKVEFIYIAGGISGSVSTALLQPHLSLLGASAAVYALLMSHIPHINKNFYVLSYRYLRIIALIILLCSDICFTTYHFIINHNMNPRICLEAHIGGGIAGFFFGYLLYTKKNP